MLPLLWDAEVCDVLDSGLGNSLILDSVTVLYILLLLFRCSVVAYNDMI